MLVAFEQLTFLAQTLGIANAVLERRSVFTRVFAHIGLHRLLRCGSKRDVYLAIKIFDGAYRVGNEVEILHTVYMLQRYLCSLNLIDGFVEGTRQVGWIGDLCHRVFAQRLVAAYPEHCSRCGNR